jgi:hypothetical protein
MMAEYYRKLRLDIDSISWTPVVLPFEYRQLVMRCDTADVKIRTEVADSATEDTFVSGVQEVIQLSYKVGSPEGTTKPPAWLQAVTGSPTVVLTCIV